MALQSIGDVAGPASSGLILIVDDDPGQRMDCREYLEQAGFVVDDAGDGRKALRRLAAGDEALPGLILLDLSMPFMDGWDFMSTLRSQPRLASIPVALMSAYEADSEIQNAVAAYLRKPVEPEQLLATVRSLLSSRPAANTG
jgi:CheY-like chemotaxis protein